MGLAFQLFITFDSVVGSNNIVLFVICVVESKNILWMRMYVEFADVNSI